MDVGDELAVANAVATVLADKGGLDIIVASHGLNSVDDNRISELNSALFHRILDVNLGGVVYLAKHGTNALKRSDGGVFLAISSGPGSRPGPIGAGLRRRQGRHLGSRPYPRLRGRPPTASAAYRLRPAPSTPR